MVTKIDFTEGRWTHCSDSYDAVGFNERTNSIIIEKTTRYGIYYTDTKITRITRKLSKNKTIRLANHILDLSKMQGIA